jgi:hypothetical protein
MAALICICVAGQGYRTSALAQTAPPDQPSRAGELRFPVAYLHGGSWCYGFLYGSDERIRFEVVQPESAKSFSFEAPRAEVSIHQWVLLGTPQDAIELKTGGKTYHMRWLANPDEILNGGASRWTPPAALAPYALIAAMQNPSATLAALAQRGVQPGNLATNTGPPAGTAPGPVTNEVLPPANPGPGASTPSVDESAQDIPSGMLAGVYVSTADSNLRPRNSQYIFYPDGFVMNGVPEEGMLAFDFNRYRTENNREGNWVGRYQLQGDLVKIDWVNRQANPSIIQLNQSIAQSPASTGPQVFFPACRCTAKHFSGVYHWNAGRADQYIEFFPNGTFIDNRVLDEMIAPSRFFDHPRIQNGTYQIARQTIIFTFADGNRATRTFLAPKVQQGDPRFDWISLGRQMFFEQNYRVRISQEP